MPEKLITLEAFGQIHNAVRGGVQVRVIDLVRIARHDNFGADPRAGHNGFNLMRRQVLGFVHDHVLLGDGTAPDISESFHFQFMGIEQILNLVIHFFRIILQMALIKNKFQVVKNRLHPVHEFFVFSARQIADILAERNDGAGNQNPAVFLFIQGFQQSGGQGQQSFSCSSRTH